MCPSLEHKAPRTESSGGRLESGQYGPADAFAAFIGLDVHALDFGRCRIDQPDGPAADGTAAVPSHKEGPPAALEMLGLEVGPEALLGRIELGQAGVQGRDQSLRILRIKRFSGDRKAQVAIIRVGVAPGNSGAGQDKENPAIVARGSEVRREP
jgi:hypothetical protein